MSLFDSSFKPLGFATTCPDCYERYMREAAASKVARGFYLYKLELERKEKMNKLIDELLYEITKE